jgi:hypothetical protein
LIFELRYCSELANFLSRRLFNNIYFKCIELLLAIFSIQKDYILGEISPVNDVYINISQSYPISLKLGKCNLWSEHIKSVEIFPQILQIEVLQWCASGVILGKVTAGLTRFNIHHWVIKSLVFNVELTRWYVIVFKLWLVELEVTLMIEFLNKL